MFCVLLTLRWRPAKPNVLASFPTAIFQSSSNVLPNAENLSASRLQVKLHRKRNWDYLSISTKCGWHFFQLSLLPVGVTAQYSVSMVACALSPSLGIIFEGEPYGHFGSWLPLKGANLNSQTCVVFSWYSTNIPLRTMLSGGDHHLSAPLGPTRTTPEPSALLKTPNLATTTLKCNRRVIDPSPPIPIAIHRDPTPQATHATPLVSKTRCVASLVSSTRLEMFRCTDTLSSPLVFGSPVMEPEKNRNQTGP